MDSERNEVYERIPWETLETKGGGDRQWWMFALAGAIVLGALAYSYMSNRPASQQPPPTVAVATTLAAPPATDAVLASTAAAPVTEVGAPIVVAEADLYAIPPERLVDQAAAHAEWFVTEYVGVDGSEESHAALTALMPAGVSVPAPPESSRVFVEWVRAVRVEEVAPLVYRVTVLVRSLLANGEEPYRRQAPYTATVDVRVAEAGPQVVMPPVLGVVTNPEPVSLTLVPVPADVEASAIAASGASAVSGGIQTAAGGWLVVVTAPGPDGVARLVTVPVP